MHDVGLGGEVSIVIVLVIFGGEESAAGEGGVEIILIPAAIFEWAMEDGGDIASVGDFLVLIETSEAATSVGSIFDKHLALGISHLLFTVVICY